jgi:sterol desaturase/sphingolipid hydroxylase (fatty acid hydroxylase superfamily)
LRPAPTFLGLSGALVFLAICFGTIERLWPAIRGVPFFSRSRGPDFIYWFLTPLFTRGASKLALGGALAGVAALASFPGGPAALLAHLEAVSPLSRIPAFPQLLLALFVGDFFSYWTHRLFHRGRLWKFHAIHHSAIHLDWLAATRLHPVNDWLAKLLSTFPLLLLGFRLKIFAAVLPILTLWAIFIHANVNWGFGPLKYFIATPLFHRWHHTSQAEGLDKNFAGLFPVLDMIFGTIYLPAARFPERFGVSGDKLPETFLAQLVYPFRP